MEGSGVFKDALKRANTPLGIISLAFVFIYAFAIVFFTMSFSKIDGIERLIIIIFLVTFPIFVFITFTWLIVKHHRKLYAPFQYQDESNFFKEVELIDQHDEERNIESKYEEIISTSGIKGPNQEQIVEKVINIERDILDYLRTVYKSPVHRRTTVHVEGKEKNQFDAYVDQEPAIYIDFKFVKDLQQFNLAYREFEQKQKRVSNILTKGLGENWEYNYIIVIGFPWKDIESKAASLKNNSISEKIRLKFFENKYIENQLERSRTQKQ